VQLTLGVGAKTRVETPALKCMLRCADFSHGNNARDVFLHRLGL